MCSQKWIHIVNEKLKESLDIKSGIMLIKWETGEQEDCLPLYVCLFHNFPIWDAGGNNEKYLFLSYNNNSVVKL